MIKEYLVGPSGTSRWTRWRHNPDGWYSVRPFFGQKAMAANLDASVEFTIWDSLHDEEILRDLRP